MFKKFLFLLFILTFSLNSYSAELQNSDSPIEVSEKRVVDPKNTLYIELKDGIVIAELFPKIAPMHVQRIRVLTANNFYNNVKFHRVIAGFMAQTGDPRGTGRGGSELGKLYAEFNNEHHTRGTLSMARATDPNSANSQFFIVTGDFFPELDGQYTIFGRILEGMEFVDKIKVGDSSKNGTVENPDVMIRVVTGDMLNNKNIETIKEEIAIINELQNEKIKTDPNYQKKSVLGLLLETKDIDINAGVEEKTNNVIKEVKDNEIKDSEIKENKNIEKEEQKNLIQKESTKEEKILKDEVLNENNNFQKNINEQKDDIDNLINSLE